MTESRNKISTETFPFSVITPIAEGSADPTFASLQLAQSQLNANARSVHTSAGTGLHGHMVLTMQPDIYLATTNNVVHEAPVYPGSRAALLPGMSAILANITSTEFKDNLHAFDLYHDTDKILVKQLIAATPDEHIFALHDEHAGYGNITTLQMLTHLWTTYGLITREELKANLARLNEPWHPTTSIVVFFKQVQKAATFAINGNAPIGDANIVMHAYNNIEATGVFTVACRDWELKPIAEQTFANFRTHFQQAYKLLPATAKSAGYHTANAVQSLTAADVEQIVRKSLASHNKKSSAPPAPTSTPGELTYCWTHGLSKNKSHDGKTCKNKAHGHQDAATVDNKMGGSERVYTVADKRPRE